MSRTPIHYFCAGDIERGADYHWVTGYSRITEKGHQYPLLTKREAQQDAMADGGKAVFHETKEAARAAFEKDKS